MEAGSELASRETERGEDDLRGHNVTLFREYVRNNCFSEVVSLTYCMNFFNSEGTMNNTVHDLVDFYKQCNSESEQMGQCVGLQL